MSIEAMKQALDALLKYPMTEGRAIQALRQAIEQAEQIEPDLPPVEIGVDVTEHGTTVMAFYRRPNAVMEMFYSQFHPQPKQPKNPPIRIQNHTHTDHFMQHWDRTCPACVAEEQNWIPKEVVYKNTVYQAPDGFANIQSKVCDQQGPNRCQTCGGALPVTGRLDRTGECDCIEPLANPIANQAETAGSPMPVAWVSEPEFTKQLVEGRPRRVWWECNTGIGTPFYTTPPEVRNWQQIAEYRLKLMFDLAKRKEWVGLTDTEVMNIYGGEWLNNMDFACAIEAKLKEKNGGS